MSVSKVVEITDTIYIKAFPRYMYDCARNMLKEDTLFWQLSINHNMVVQDQWYTYHNGATSLILTFFNLAYDGL